MSKRQYTTPVVVRNGNATALTPIPPEESYESEDWFQKLLFEHPSLLPIEDIEPGFGQLIPVARELPTERGPLDLLFIDCLGHLILVETKLWRNPEARRKVVGQIVDYATAISRWSYDDLCAATNEVALSNSADPLSDLAQKVAGPDFDQSRFTDAVTLNLARGRFLLLIVGDGIHEGVEQMGEFFDRYPQLGFRLGLVEVGLYRLGGNSDELYVQPRVVAVTREVVRAIVEVRTLNPTDVIVRPPPELARRLGGHKLEGRASLTEEDFFSRLREVDPDLPILVSEVLREAPQHNLDVEWRRNGPILKYRDEASGEFLNFGQFSPEGRLAYTGWLSTKCNRLELPDTVWRDYYIFVANLLGGAKLQEGHERDVAGTNWTILGQDGEDSSLEPLLRQRQAWFMAIDAAIVKARAALTEE